MFPPPYELIECIDLFNILNAEINGLARISDTNYLYLLDCRSRKEYDESHVISATHIRHDKDGQYQIPWHADLETREHIVLYDNVTDSLPLNEKVYLGRREHAVNSQIVKDLKFRAYVNCTKHDDFIVQNGDSRKYCRVPIDDVHDAKNISDLLRDAVNFISVAYDRGDPVLVYSDRGVSRSAAVIVAFISFHKRISSKEALEYVEKHRDVRPQQSFIGHVDQLNEKLQELKEAMSSANHTSKNHDEQTKE
ncbi:unnamed protein product [Adineta ricciae]|uniref:protein-tyrosine-phosphatase n=1 Tax=Adineta ricciae TaxID=249248 RepID=A0A815BF54_ADIRI|nr:unnamed protein product [Adineta ricciae]